jgi:CubicO group peptidase (beta-lactamase class C family)
MKTPLACSFVLALLTPMFAACHGVDAPPAPVVSVGDPNDPRFAAVLAAVENDMTAHGVPGASVAVVLGGQLAFAAGLGVKKEGETDAVTASTLFRVASLSKMVLSATAMKLVEEGKLDPTRPVTDYVPLGLAPGFDPSTLLVRHLLTHTSGLPDFNVATPCPVGAGQLGAYFAAQYGQPLWSPPGQVWNYSNQGFSVAGWIIETASGQRFEDAVASRVFGPAGMTTATYEPALARSADHAVGHHPASGTQLGENMTFYEPDAYDCEAARPPAGVMASVIDYAHFVEVLLASGGSTLSPASVSAMETGHVDTDNYPSGGEHYGYGLYVSDWYQGLHVLRHDGDDVGFRSTLWIVPSSGLAVIVFYNVDTHYPTTPVEAAIDQLLGLQGVARATETTPATTWGKYAGTYVDPNVLGTITVTFDGSGLTGSAPTMSIEDLPLTQVAGDRFQATRDGTTGDITFYPDSTGTPRWFVTREGVGTRQ